MTQFAWGYSHGHVKHTIWDTMEAPGQQDSAANKTCLSLRMTLAASSDLIHTCPTACNWNAYTTICSNRQYSSVQGGCCALPQHLRTCHLEKQHIHTPLPYPVETTTCAKNLSAFAGRLPPAAERLPLLLHLGAGQSGPDGCPALPLQAAWPVQQQASGV